MVLISKLLKIVLPPVTLVLICLFLPPYIIYKFLSGINRFIFRENVAGKVILITGASSGIGEHLAYEYARRGACLALVARREDCLHVVAAKARRLGSPDVIVIPSDVSKVEDCKRFIDETCNHFGRLDHLVNNAGVVQLGMFDGTLQISEFQSLMSINYWGSVYATHYAVPHLRKSKGKIIVIASVSGWFPSPKLSFYNASKAALTTFFDTLRMEFGSDIGITIVSPGVIDTRLTLEEFRSEVVPPESAEACAKAIVNGTCRGERNMTVPSSYIILFVLRLLFPEVVDWISHLSFANQSKKMLPKTKAINHELISPFLSLFMGKFYKPPEKSFNFVSL